VERVPPQIRLLEEAPLVAGIEQILAISIDTGSYSIREVRWNLQ
jgi:hypothetical protein